MTDSSEEKLINSRKRVRNHGEVFTPSHIVRRMLDLPSVNEACRDLTKTFFEPGAGEGAFLVEVLTRKLSMVEKEHGERLDRYENYSLLALSTVYGIELLEDNAKRCTMALYEVFHDFYRKQLQRHDKQAKPSVKSSARLIISKNIVQGDFLTKSGPSGTPVVFSEWKALNLAKRPITLMVQRTEYTLDEIEHGVTKQAGSVVDPNETKGQISLPFDEVGPEDWASSTLRAELRYLPCKITTVYREEQEQVNGQDDH